MQHLQHITELGQLLARLEIANVIIAPGSRNAPLIQLFTGDRRFVCHSIVDERSAGYVALGMARHLCKPVVVVTTSGTAVLNLAPAVAEAFYQQVPFILLTADRPLEQIRQFNNQVIDQMAPFYSHTKGFYDFSPDMRSEQELKQALSAIQLLLKEAVTFPGGPVHVNLPLDEPLYAALPEPLTVPAEVGMDSGPEEDEPWPAKPFPANMKILVLAGMGAYNEAIRSLLVGLASVSQTVVVAENIANLPSVQFIANPEIALAALSEETTEELAPDLVITFGGQLVSKRLKHFIQSLHGVEVFEITGVPENKLQSLLDSMKQSGTPGSRPTFSNTYLKAWKKVEDSQLERSAHFLAKAPFCNLTATKAVLSSLPGNSVVHLGNSGTIRYAQLMPLRDDLRFYANRGTSGIDGCVSSAVGAALVSNQVHTLLLGDLSFVYDSNALWNQHFPNNLKVVVLNDGGGGIFRLLDGPDQMEFFEEFSVTHHPVSLELLAQSFGRDFQRVSGREALKEALSHLFRPGSSLTVLEVDTSNSENSRIFAEHFESLKQH